MKKKILSFVLAMTIAGSLLTGCGSDTSDGSSDDGDNGNMPNITLTFPILTAVPADLDKVEAAMSEIAEEKAGCTITLQPLGFADYTTQASLMLSGGEDIGLMIHFDPITNFSTMVQKGQIQDITELVDEYAPEIRDVVDEAYLSTSTVDGKLYGVPTLHDLATGYGVIMRTDLLEKYNIDVSGIETLEDLEPVFATIKENETDIAPMFTGGAAMNPLDAVIKTRADILGDGYGVLMNRGQETTVANYFETQEYKDYVSLFYDWGQKGYLLADSESIQDTYTTLFKANKIFASFMTTKPGQVYQDERNTGMDLTLVEIEEPLTMTNLVNGLQWIVPAGASNPQKSVEVMKLLYTDAEFLNLLNYGIEGEHYVVTGDNTISLPEGVTADKSPFNWSIAYESGNEFLCYTWDTDEEDLWEKTKQYNEEAERSKAMGFIFDSSNVSAEITALANVSSQYRVGLENGALDPEEYLDQFIADLKTAGIDTVITEKQNQLDEWLKAN